MKNKITDLRNHLFAQLEKLSDDLSESELDQEVKRSKAIGNIAQTIINSAKVEAFYCANAKMNGTGFFQIDSEKLNLDA
jgi:hypothetical protein